MHNSRGAPNGTVAQERDPTAPRPHRAAATTATPPRRCHRGRADFGEVGLLVQAGRPATGCFGIVRGEFS